MTHPSRPVPHRHRQLVAEQDPARPLRVLVIHRPVCSIPGIETHFTQTLDIDVVRIRTGGTYEDGGRRLGVDTAVSLRVIERLPARHAARFAFKLAMLPGAAWSRRASTIQKDRRTVPGDGEGRRTTSGHSRTARAVRFAPGQRDHAPRALPGDRHAQRVRRFPSDMACGLIGSVGLGDSASLRLRRQRRGEDGDVRSGRGTAPDIAGKEHRQSLRGVLRARELAAAWASSTWPGVAAVGARMRGGGREDRRHGGRLGDHRVHRGSRGAAAALASPAPPGNRRCALEPGVGRCAVMKRRSVPSNPRSARAWSGTNPSPHRDISRGRRAAHWP